MVNEILIATLVAIAILKLQLITDTYGILWLAPYVATLRNLMDPKI